MKHIKRPSENLNNFEQDHLKILQKGLDPWTQSINKVGVV